MTLPSDELRAAAALLRKRGAEATPGPWERPLNTCYKDVVTAAKPDDEPGKWLDGRPETVGVVQVGVRSSGAHYRKRSGRDLEWIALASPLLAEPLAAVLEEAAELYEWALARCHVDLRQQLEPRVRVQVEHELAVARALNGGQQS